MEPTAPGRRTRGRGRPAGAAGAGHATGEQGPPEPDGQRPDVPAPDAAALSAGDAADAAARRAGYR